MNKLTKQAGQFAIILAIAFMGGAVPVLGKIALMEVPPFSYTLLRFILALLILLPFYLKIRKPIKGDFWKILGLSLLAMGNVLFFAFGVQHTSAGVVQAIYTASPLLAAVLSFFLLKEKFSPMKVFGILVGFIGALIIIFLPLIEKGITNEVTLLGNILIVIAMISVTLFTVLSKPFHKKYHPLEITTFFSIVTVTAMLPLFFMELQRDPLWWQALSTEAIWGVLYVGFFGTALYYLAVQIIIKKTTPTLASMVLYVQPFAAIYWAALFLDEKFSAIFFVGIFLALAGVWMTLTARKT